MEVVYSLLKDGVRAERGWAYEPQWARQTAIAGDEYRQGPLALAGQCVEWVAKRRRDHSRIFGDIRIV